MRSTVGRAGLDPRRITRTCLDLGYGGPFCGIATPLMSRPDGSLPFAARSGHESTERIRPQTQTAGGVPRSGRVTRDARCTPCKIPALENLRLHAAECRLQVGARARHFLERFVAGSRGARGCNEQPRRRAAKDRKGRLGHARPKGQGECHPVPAGSPGSAPESFETARRRLPGLKLTGYVRRRAITHDVITRRGAWPGNNLVRAG